ncbi:hypothetical protein NDA16_002765 [Ustilago loliicola]|nr:hypothetical protein NDA16_002765 [Ustilago loliicola]
MARSILVAGATGNTGRAVVETLSKLFKSQSDFADYRILATTRSSKGSAAKALSRLDQVEVIEKSWSNITPQWLSEHEVKRAFIASHNEPAHFAEESGFYLAALHAGLNYVVRISTTAANVRPDCKAYYPRSHWAIEAMLSSPEFDGLQWTSLQPNVFSQSILAPAVVLINKSKDSGKQEKLGLMISQDDNVGIVDSNDVGVFAAHLLVTRDVSKHNKAKYVLNGPENITGREVVAMVEQAIGSKVEHVSFGDMSWLPAAASQSPTPSLIMSIQHALDTAHQGKCAIDTTSKEVFDIAPPQTTPWQTLQTLLTN